jgi:hypothetical protein
MTGRMRRVQAAVLLCCLLLATSSPAALGICHDECMAATCDPSTFRFICYLACSETCQEQATMGVEATGGTYLQTTLASHTPSLSSDPFCFKIIVADYFIYITRKLWSVDIIIDNGW